MRSQETPLVLAKTPEIALPWWEVLALLAAVGVFSATAGSRRASPQTLRRLAILSSALYVALCAGLASADFKILSRAVEENNVLEWLTTVFLAWASVIAFVAAVGSHRRGSPSPTAMVLAAGFTWGWARELEYGGNLFAGQFWFTRNLFRPESFLGVSYFERFQERMRLPYDATTLYAVHLCFTAAALAAIVLLAKYAFCHRAAAGREARGFLRTLHGRLYALGVGLYVAAELIGGALHRLPQWSLFAGLAEARADLYHSIVEESLECWAAMALWFCALALWQASRRTRTSAPDADVARRPTTPAT